MLQNFGKNSFHSSDDVLLYVYLCGFASCKKQAQGINGGSPSSDI